MPAMALFLLESKDDERQDNFLLKNPLLWEFMISSHTGFKLVN